MNRCTRIIIILVCVSLLGACKIPGQSASPSASAPVAENGCVLSALGYTGCGPRALATVLNHLGVSASEAELAALADAQPDGTTTMLGLAQAARAKGLEATGYHFELDELSTAPLPLIAHVRENHYVVVLACEEDQVTIQDVHTSYAMPLEKFGEQWRGYALVVSTTDERPGTKDER